jgi:hypothetical protein
MGLDSTRVHVDEESLREWFDETQKINIARYAQTVLAEGPHREYHSFLSYVSSAQERLASTSEDSSLDAEIGSEFLLLNTVDASLRAFSTDRTFGLDSYLSRRIRHGTLNGHVMTPINRVLRRLAEKAAELGNTDSSIGDLIAKTSKFLLSELDHTRKNVIQINSAAHPEGLICVTWKTSVNIKYLDAMFARVRERVLETTRPRRRTKPILAPFATGSAVIADVKRLGHIEQQHRKVAALDMETYGVYYAARELARQDSHFFSVKAVVDFADHHKDDDLHQYGSIVSANAAVRVIRKLRE